MTSKLNPSSNYKTLLFIEQIKGHAKSSAEIAKLTGESNRQVKRRLRQAKQWGADIVCHQKKLDNGGFECFYFVANYQQIKPMLETWIAIEEAILNHAKPLLIIDSGL